MPREGTSGVHALETAPFRWPVLTALALMAIALALKAVDTFVLRLDERLGEIILSKSLGFVLVVWFTWAAGRRVSDLGLHRRRLAASLSIGVGLTVIAYAVGYGVEYVGQLQSGGQPALYVGAIDPKAGVSGGLFFAAFLTVGNIINAFMEEGLFRGLMLPVFRTKLSFWRANWLQAFLFGVWHLMWVAKYYQTGAVRTPGEILFAAASNSLPQLCMGLVWGYIYLKTGSLWGPWASHLITNAASNLLHVRTLEGMDVGFGLRMVLFVVVAMLGMVLVRAVAGRLEMRELAAWEPQGPLSETPGDTARQLRATG